MSPRRFLRWIPVASQVVDLVIEIVDRVRARRRRKGRACRR